MSTIGKVLVFLVLVLSVAFLASSIFVLNAQENYRQKYNDEVTARAKDKSDADQKIKDLSDKNDQLRNTVGNRDSALASVQAERDNLKSRLSTEENYRNSTSENINKLTTNLDNFRKDIDNLNGQLAEASKTIDTLRGERDSSKKSQEDAENKLAQSDEGGKQLQAQVNSLMAKVKDLTESNTLMDNALQAYAERTGIPRGEVAMAPPPISGNVVSVAADVKLVELNVGSDSNVKKGYSFTIYRGSEYKGEAIVEDVQPKFCTARIRSAVKKIEVGDQARAGIF